MLTRRWLAVLAIAVFSSACDISTNTATSSAKPTPSAVETIGPQEWDLLEGTLLTPAQQKPLRCNTGPTPVRSGVVPAIGSNPTQLKLKVREPTAVLWQVVGNYSGPILLRGRQLSGTSPVYFASLETPATDLSSAPIPEGQPLKALQTSHGAIQLYGGVRLAVIGGAHSWWTYVYVERPGCFFWQQNGRDYSGILTFEVAP